MNSIMNETYPKPGTTLGPTLIFGCITARDAMEAVSIRKGMPTVTYEMRTCTLKPTRTADWLALC